MKIDSLVCWKCGASITDLPMPLARLAECHACHAELHVCKLCEFHDKQVADQCREPVADRVREKEKANFCDYFQPRPDAYSPPGNDRARVATAELNALFGVESDADGGPEPEEKERILRELDQLFGTSNKNDQ